MKNKIEYLQWWGVATTSLRSNNTISLGGNWDLERPEEEITFEDYDDFDDSSNDEPMKYQTLFLKGYGSFHSSLDSSDGESHRYHEDDDAPMPCWIDSDEESNSSSNELFESALSRSFSRNSAIRLLETYREHTVVAVLFLSFVVIVFG